MMLELFPGVDYSLPDAAVAAYEAAKAHYAETDSSISMFGCSAAPDAGEAAQALERYFRLIACVRMVHSGPMEEQGVWFLEMAKALEELGEIELAVRTLDATKTHYRKCLYPDFPTENTDLMAAEMLVRARDLGGAIEYARRALEAAGEIRFPILSLLGLFHHDAREFTAAVDCYLQALANWDTPQNPIADTYREGGVEGDPDPRAVVERLLALARQGELAQFSFTLWDLGRTV